MFTSSFRLPPAGPCSASDWARASGMYTLGGLLPSGWATVPMMVNFAPPIVIVPPVFRPFEVA